MADNIWAVPLALSNFNIVVAVLGGFISLFGLVSYLLKENYYLSEARGPWAEHSLGKIGYLMPRTISRVLSENISNSGENSRVISRISSMSRWFSSGKADPEAIAKAGVDGQPLSNASVSGPSEPHPMLHPVPPRLHTVDEDSTSQEDAMPARRREIRFYDEPEPRPADMVASSSEAPLYTVPQASPPGIGVPEPKAVDTRLMELGSFPSESHAHSE